MLKQMVYIRLLLLLSHSVISNSVRSHRRGSPPGCPVPGILQARALEWVAISFSSAWKWKVMVKSLSRVWLLAIPWTAAYQAPPSMGFSRQDYWSGVPLPSLYKAVVFKLCSLELLHGLVHKRARWPAIQDFKQVSTVSVGSTVRKYN